ncbi:MAG: hypothetical protein R3C19_02135 [Planctomycetaceae bacterium]
MQFHKSIGGEVISAGDQRRSDQLFDCVGEPDITSLNPGAVGIDRMKIPQRLLLPREITGQQPPLNILQLCGIGRCSRDGQQRQQIDPAE